MNLWFRKIAVVLITIMTLGIYVPPMHFNAEIDDSKDRVSSSEDINLEVQKIVSESVNSTPQSTTHEDELSHDELIQMMTQKAREQAISKLGPKIIQGVDHEFTDIILPTIESVLQTILIENNEQELPYYGMTEHPTGGFGEKIFHVYDMRTEQDIVRFHVRRDNRPKEGYWFNFHYHLSEDNFEEHHEIGEIYWNKNIPPKWMS